jgi:hypothetical protein
VYYLQPGKWENIDYAGAVSGSTVTLKSELLRYTVLGDNYFVIASN